MSNQKKNQQQNHCSNHKHSKLVGELSKAKTDLDNRKKMHADLEAAQVRTKGELTLYKKRLAQAETSHKVHVKHIKDRELSKLSLFTFIALITGVVIGGVL